MPACIFAINQLLMHSNRWLGSVLCWVLFVGCAAAKKQPAETDSLPAAALRPFGRTLINKDQNLELIGSASHFGIRFEGTECRILVSLPAGLDHNYLQYELDGVYQKRVRVSANDSAPVVLTASTGGTHEAWIYKATEAQTGSVVIQSITANDPKPIQRPSLPLIEFIGNSITCGAAADTSEVPCGAGVYHDQHNAYMAYGPRVARTLGANFLLSSVSGIGIYRNWNSNGPAMPEVYENTTFQPNGPLWNFSLYAPTIVSIALGTNDFSRGDGKQERLPFDSAKFVRGYMAFVESVKAKYPKAQIALLSSPMINGEARALLQRCLLAVKHGVDALNKPAKPVAVYFLNPMQAKGCSGHPSVDDHRILAEELTPFFRKLLQQ